MNADGNNITFSERLFGKARQDKIREIQKEKEILIKPTMSDVPLFSFFLFLVWAVAKKEGIFFG